MDTQASAASATWKRLGLLAAQRGDMPTASMRRAGIAAAVVAALCAIGMPAHAVPITYTLSGAATGSVGASEFSGASFVVTLRGDTAGVTSIGPGVPCNDPTRASFEIRGVASGSITTPVSVAANAGWQLVAIALGRCAEPGEMWANGRNPQFGDYDLAHDLGPVSLTLPSAPPGLSLSTSQGVLALRSVSGLAFQSQLGAAPVAAAAAAADPAITVPALSGEGLGLLAAMLGGVGVIAARRRMFAPDRAT